jgi:hypothetical protein
LETTKVIVRDKAGNLFMMERDEFMFGQIGRTLVTKGTHNPRMRGVHPERGTYTSFTGDNGSEYQVYKDWSAVEVILAAA